MATIERQDPVNLSQDWGLRFQDYKIDGTPVDFQDLMVAVAENRATTVEKEVSPLTTRIKARNKTLENLGDALGDLTKVQAGFKSDDPGDKRSNIEIKLSSFQTLQRVFGTLDFSNRKMLKYEVEEWIQKVKSKIDALNNEAQSDMTRLQGLVDRRDEAFSTATDLMSTISDTRGNLVRNL